MADKNKQKLMYSDKDLMLIKAVFAENEELLTSIRHLFFGVEISEYEKEVIKETFKNKELVEVLRKKVYGLNNFDTPIGQLSDFWMGAEQQIFGASKDTIYQAVQSKVIVLDMFTKAFNLLTNPDGERVSVVFTPSVMDDLQVNLIARNLYMKAIETALLTVKTIAGTKEETLAQTLKRLEANSSK